MLRWHFGKQFHIWKTQKAMMIRPTCKLLDISNPFLVGDVWNITLILSRSLILLNMLNWILKCILRIPPIHILVTGCCRASSQESLESNRRSWNCCRRLFPTNTESATRVGGRWNHHHQYLKPQCVWIWAKTLYISSKLFFTLWRIIICSFCEWCDSDWQIWDLHNNQHYHQNQQHHHQNSESATRVGGRWQSSRWLLQRKGHEHRRLWSKQMIMLVESSTRGIPTRSQ